MRTLPSSSPRRVVFDRMKYGAPLLVDACRIADIHDFTLAGTSHRLGFHEVALITGGHGVLELDDAPIEIAPRRIFVTAPGEVRRWQLRDPSLDGMLVFFEANFLNDFVRDARFVERLALMTAAPSHRSLAPTAKRFDAALGIAGTMRDELQAPRADSEHALRAETYRLLVDLQRLAAPYPAPRTASRPCARRLLERFEERVEESFAHHHRVAEYAAMLGVSERHLNGCVREASGITARDAIHRRQHQEARRLLVHTRLPVAAIAEQLGFADSSWFIRFFKRHAGATPLAFRRRHESDISVRIGDLPGY